LLQILCFLPCIAHFQTIFRREKRGTLAGGFRESKLREKNCMIISGRDTAGDRIPREFIDVQLCFSETEMKFLKVLLQKITAFYEFRLTDWLLLKLERL